MAYWENLCIGCAQIHDAALWYSRTVSGKKECLCGERHHGRKDQGSWEIEPGPPPGSN